MNCAPYLAALATSTPLPEMTWLCGLAQAPMRESSGRLAKYSSLSSSDLFHHALDAHHTFQLYPVELQGCVGVTSNLAALAAVVVGKPDDAALVIALDQHDAGAGAQVAAHGGQGHGVGLGHFGTDGFFEPLVKLLQGGGVRGVFVEFGALVALAKVGDGGGHGPIVHARAGRLPATAGTL